MAVFFYIFATLVTLSAVMIIFSKNPVHSVLWLIFAFCNSSGLMILIGAEFIAMMLIIIYVGAVAVLFLFVVMMLDINFTGTKANIGKGSNFTLFMAVLLFADIVVIILLSNGGVAEKSHTDFAIIAQEHSVYTIGKVLYTDFILPFQTSGLILFAAMIASISLTHRMRSGVKRQKIEEQMARSKDNGLATAIIDGKNGLNNLNYDD